MSVVAAVGFEPATTGAKTGSSTAEL